MESQTVVDRICSIRGKVLWATGLPNTDLSFDETNVSDPYCVIKAILSTGNMITLAKTRVLRNTLAPVWDEHFDVQIPAHINNLNALRFAIYDFDDATIEGDESLGTWDIDVSLAGDGRKVALEGDLTCPSRRGRRNKARGRMAVEFTVSRKKARSKALCSAEMSCPIQRVISSLNVIVISAQGLLNTDAVGLSDPYCIIKAGFFDGTEKLVGRTKVIQDSINPEWNESFDYDVEDAKANPILYLVFSIFDCDHEGGAPERYEDDFLAEAFFHLSRADFDTFIPVTIELDTVASKIALADKEAKSMGEALHRKMLSVGKRLVPSAVQNSVNAAYYLTKRSAQSFARTQLKRVRKGIKMTRALAHVAAVLLTWAPTEDDAEDAKNEQTTRMAKLKKSRRKAIATAIAAKAPRSFRALGRKVSAVTVGRSGSFRSSSSGSSDNLPEWGPSKYFPELKINIMVQGTVEKVPNNELLDTATEIIWRSRENVIRKVKPFVSCICGEVFGARELFNFDLVGKSDPYCNVVIYFQDGSSQLIHRTKVINDTLNPTWRERFYFKQDNMTSKMTKIQFNIYDSDAGKFSGEDDFLGFAKVWLKDIDVLHGMEEEIFLGGIKRKMRVDPVSGRKVHAEKLESTLKVSVYVKWRLHALPPVYVTTAKETWKPRPRHQNTWERENVVDNQYVDPSQAEVIKEDSSDLAPSIWHLYKSNRFPKKLHRVPAWEETPVCVPYASQVAIRDPPTTERVVMSDVPLQISGLLEEIPTPIALIKKTVPAEIKLTDGTPWKAKTA